MGFTLVAIEMTEDTLERALNGGVPCSNLALGQRGNGTFLLTLDPPKEPKLAPLTNGQRQSNARRSTPRGANRDPRWSRCVYGPKPCTRCGNTIGKAAEMFYCPDGPDKGIYCVWTHDANDPNATSCAKIMADKYGIAHPNGQAVVA